MTYAIFTTGGQQFRAEEGVTIKVPLLAAEPGSKVTFDRVLLASDGKNIETGTPTVKGAKVTAEVVRHGKGKAVTTFVFLMNRTAFFDGDLLAARAWPDRLPVAEGRRLSALFLALVVPSFFFLPPFMLRTPVTPVLFLTFATCSPRLLQQMLHEFGIFSVS